MKWNIAAGAAAWALVLTVASTAPARPASRPSREISPMQSPTTAPSIKAARSDDSTFPSPGELLRRMKQREQREARTPKVAYFDLSRPITEKPAEFSLFGNGDGSFTLRELLGRLQKAQDDKDIRAVLITLGDSGLNLSQAMELRDALGAIHRAGKRTFVYADAYDTDTYIAASGATDICLMEGGEIELPGVGFQTMFAKGLLDLIGVKADYVQIGEYKGADEEYTRSEASEELRGQLDKLADSLFNQIIDTIASSRKMSNAQVKDLVDRALISAKVAHDNGLVDHLVDMDGLRDLLAAEMGEKTELMNDYGAAPRESIDLSSPFGLLSALSHKPETSLRPGVALIYAQGVIVDGAGGGGLFSESSNVGSEDMRVAMRLAERDDKVKAIVIRIDSPGGSALASEVMWQAVRRVAKTKPVIMSVGSMAASGGYYLASSGNRIFADPCAIVGSIGVVGGKFVLAGLYKQLGLNTESFSRGKNADLFSSDTEWTPGQRRLVTSMMRDTYDQFTDRVMTMRKGKIKDIDAVARGRIFTARQARELGMIDEIGGVQDAIAYAAQRVDLAPGTYDVHVLPAPRTLSDIMAAISGAETRTPFTPHMAIGAGSLLAGLPASTRHLIDEQLQILQLLDRRHVALVSPFVMSVK